MAKRVRNTRTLEEREAEIDARIKYHEDHVATWKEKRAKLRASKNKAEYKNVLDEMLADGRSPEEIRKALSQESA